MTFFAKSKLINGKQITVKEHCEVVKKLSETFGKELGFEKEAELAGKLHDFGKYSKDFQGVLNGTSSHIDHAICGACVLQNCFCSNCAKTKDFLFKKKIEPIIEVINGHHDGLIEYELLEETLIDIFNGENGPMSLHNKQSALFGKNDYEEALAEFGKDFPGFSEPILTYDIPSTQLESMLYTRMLLSCLVDADYSGSALDENPFYLAETGEGPHDFKVILDDLYAYRNKKFANADPCLDINRIRNYVFEMCGEAGDGEEGLYSLTAPTGTAKTLALLHFALRQCINKNKKHIIIVLPFLTLMEQNASVYREICPNLIEDHSQSRLSDEERDFASRWSAPITLTTSVRFFESLFSCHPADCRKLHHIANSVVIFDEAQSLPADLAKCSLQAVNELCHRYHTTMLFSTATQPNFEVIKDLTWKPKEIIPNPQSLYDKLQRVKVEWKIGKQPKIELNEIALKMAEESSICAIVNLRKHARKLYVLLSEQSSKEELFFLTTDLCPTSRRKIVKTVNQRLDLRLPCRLVSTQCIEAGVDFSFEVLYRALAPLESIVQAAGRTNRHGEFHNGGKVIVFVPQEQGHIYPGKWYEEASHVVETLQFEHPIDINNLEHLKEYYQFLLSNCPAREKLERAFQNYSYREIDREYRLIDSDGLRVIVPVNPYNSEMSYFQIKEKLLKQGISRSMIKETASITVQISPYLREKLERVAEPLFFSKNGRPQMERKSDYYILCPQYEGLYHEKLGLQLEDEKLDTFDFLS